MLLDGLRVPYLEMRTSPEAPEAGAPIGARAVTLPSAGDPRWAEAFDRALADFVLGTAPAEENERPPRR